MGTKKDPGLFDCYAKAAEDEPIFTLRAKDPAAPYMVELWVASRRGDMDKMLDLITRMSMDKNVIARVSVDNHIKLQEARTCAAEMRRWHLENNKS